MELQELLVAEWQDVDFLIPVTNQAMNRDIKVLCRIAGIDQEERITTYRGNERIDEIKKKYELVDTIKATEMSKMNFMD